MSRTLATALIIVGLVSAAGASAGVLTEIEHRVYIQYGGGGVPVTTVFDPLFAEATAGGSHALADYAAGVFKGFAQHSSGGAVATIAYSGLEAKFKNVGAGAIAYGAGDIGISIDASFLRAAGGCCGSQNDTSLIAVLSGRTDGAPRIDGFARSTYQYVESSSPFPFFDFDLTGTSGFTATGSADSTSMSVFLGFPAFMLASEQTLDINFSLQPGAFGGPLPGWEATTDAFNSAQLSMKLPAGVTLQSSVPLAWVTAAPVPEPAVIWLFAAGLLGLWALARPRFVLVTRLQEGQAVPGVGNLTIRARVSAA